MRSTLYRPYHISTRTRIKRQCRFPRFQREASGIVSSGIGRSNGWFFSQIMTHRFRFGRQGAEGGFQLYPYPFQGLGISITFNPNRVAPKIDPAGKRIRDYEPVPTGKDFFFEHANAKGTIGRPVNLASATIPG